MAIQRRMNKAARQVFELEAPGSVDGVATLVMVLDGVRCEVTRTFKGKSGRPVYTVKPLDTNIIGRRRRASRVNVPSKRIKNAWRKSGSGLSLREFARCEGCFDTFEGSTTITRAALEWLRNKRTSWMRGV